MNLLAALPDFLIAGTALLTWLDPDILGIEKISYFVLLMLLEFIVVHSAAFMGSVAFGKVPKVGRLAAIVGLGLVYTLFVGAFALGFHQSWPLWAFWTLVLNRMAGVLLGQGGEGGAAALVRIGWVAGGIFYLGSTFLTIFLPLPRFGITPAVIAAQHFTGSGLWIAEPWRVLAMATLYFTLQGVFTLKAPSWVLARRG